MKRIVLIAIMAVALALTCVPVSAAVTAEVRIGNARAGNIYAFTIQLKNDSADGANFDVYYKASGYPTEGQVASTGSAKGYTGIGDKAQVWVQIGAAPVGEVLTTNVPGSNGIIDVPIVLSIPKDTVLPNNWVFWIATAQEPSGNFIVENCSTILVSMHQDNNILWVVMGLLGVGLVILVVLLRRKTS